MRRKLSYEKDGDSATGKRMHQRMLRLQSHGARNGGMKTALHKDDQALEEASAHRLTRRQGQILNLVSLGHTNREIADLLKISVRTVEVHRFQLMRRLNVRNVAQLLRRALQLGFLSSADMRPQVATSANASVVEFPVNGKSRKLITTRGKKS